MSSRVVFLLATNTGIIYSKIGNVSSLEWRVLNDMHLSSQPLEIRSFASMQEIRDLNGFIENNPVSKLKYKRLVGDYNFGEEICCCVEKDSGKLCGQEHKKGWVVELSDATVSIVGNVCAAAKFGADSRLIQDQGRYMNEKRRLERLAVLQQQIAEKPQRLEKLGSLKALLKELEARINGFMEKLGPLVTRRLKDMARTGNSEVLLTAVKYRNGLNERGVVERETSSFQERLGALAGMELTTPGSFYSVYETINDIVRAYESVEKSEISPKKREIEAFANRLNQYDRLLKEGDRLLGLEAAFQTNNWLLLCFLTDDKSERYKVAKIAMRQAGQAGSKEDAKEWLAGQEKGIKTRLGVDSLQIR